MSVLAAFLLASAVAVPVRADDDAKKAVAALQGEWKVLSFTQQKRDLNAAKNGKVVIAGNEMTASVNGDTDILTFTLDLKAEPLAIDLKSSTSKKVIRGICKLEKDTLTICFGARDTRPTEFKSSENDSLMVLERVKK